MVSHDRSSKASEFPAEVWSEGPNFAISLLGRGLVVLRVWEVAAMTREEGAAAAVRMARELGELARTRRGLVLDLTRATATWGPKTQSALEDMLLPWELRGLPVRIVPAAEPIQGFAVRSLLKSSAPTHGAIASSLSTAIASTERGLR